MNNRICELQRFYDGDKILSPIGKMSKADKMELSLEERYRLQKKEMIDKFRNTTEINIDTDKVAVDIAKKIKQALKK